VVRAEGQPRWQPLSGTGAGGGWTDADYGRPEQLLAALTDPRSTAPRRRELTEAVRKRWFAPPEKHLRAEGKSPAVKRLFVTPSWALAKLPVELLAPGYAVSYTPSATVLARALKGRRALKAETALALGDPTFQAPALAAAPQHGLL